LFANRFLEDMEVSKDLVQDVFVKLWEKEVMITNQQTVKALLYTTVRNACLNHLREQSQKEKQIQEYQHEDTDEFLEAAQLEEEVHYKLYKALNQLSERNKESVLLTIRGYSNQEIAEEMKISVNSVKTLKQRAYKLLRKMIYLFC
jgi:RNA polymerase sigma-70 factor (ECF subfamily)